MFTLAILLINLIILKMETIILKQNGNECVKANLTFSINMNGHSTIHKGYESYNDAKNKVVRSKRIFKHSLFEIVVNEN